MNDYLAVNINQVDCYYIQFMDKKSADEYDKMLDMADNLSEMLASSTVELSDSANEELSIFLAEHREAVLVALLAKKPVKKAQPKVKAETAETAKVELTDVSSPSADAKSSEKKAAKTAKTTKAKSAKQDLSEAG